MIGFRTASVLGSAAAPIRRDAATRPLVRPACLGLVQRIVLYVALSPARLMSGACAWFISAWPRLAQLRIAGS
jgi:hypothetical protein